MSSFTRRGIVTGLAASAAAPVLSQGIVARARQDGRLAFPRESRPIIDFERLIKQPVRIASVELWNTAAGTPLVRVRSTDGAEGIVRASTKVEHTNEFFRTFAVPRFTGQDARDLADIIRRAARDDYEYAGLPYWSTLGQVELAVWDMLGKVAGRNCAEMIGPVLRRDIPIYMSSNKRDTSPEVEVAHLAERVAATGARAVKIKIGRRMGYNTDMKPGRTEAIVRLARRTLGDAMTIYVDANGAYDAVKALEIAAMLEAHGVAMFEEPCPFEDFEMTRQVTEAVRARGLKLKIAGGEQDYALEKWRWYTRNRAFDVIQPDPMYAGGIFRNLEIMRMGREAGLGFNPHFPRNGAEAVPMLALAAVSPNLYGFQEYRSREDAIEYAHSPVLVPRNGDVRLPSDPGWGVSYDPAIWRTATRVAGTERT